MSSRSPQFTVVPRSLSTPVEHTKKLVESVIKDLAPDMRLLTVNPRTGVAVVAIPDHQVEQVKTALGDAFIVDPNASLKFGDSF